MGYRSIKLGFDGSSRFPFRARTDRQTDAMNDLSHASGYAAGVGGITSALFSLHSVDRHPILIRHLIMLMT